MAESHRRKKQPEIVRRQLVEVAARIVREKGPAAVTLDAVAQAAGVSKGGLLHHFPGKAALLDGLFEQIIEEFDRAITEEMSADPVAQGRFSRAYLRVVANLKEPSEGEQAAAANPSTDGNPPTDGNHWDGLTLAMLGEPHIRDRWRCWMDERMADYVGTDSGIAALTLRLAADGLWLADAASGQSVTPQERRALVERLIASTLT